MAASASRHSASKSPHGTARPSATPLTRTDISGALAVAPRDMARAYVVGGTSYGGVFDMTSSIRSWYRNERKDKGPVCLATPDKPLLMAAILASLGGGPPIVLPASLSRDMIAETCRVTGAACVLSDRPVETPEGVRSFVPDAGTAVTQTGLHAGVHERSGTQAWLLTRPIMEPFLWLYTGGSTGTPKLWPKTPRNVIGEAVYLRDMFAIRRSDVFLSSVPPLHIYGLLFSVLLPFVSGARIAGDVPYFPREIVTAAAGAGCTVFVGSPMHYKALSASPFRLPGLRRAFSSGGFLEKQHAEHFTRATGTGVTEVYGSTETGGIATRCQTASRTAIPAAWTPFPCARWTIRDGRLRVKSPFVSPGLPTGGRGFFTTGDLAARAGDGAFVLRGRADGIVKIGGKRVDLSLIEQKIKSLPRVTDAWVLSLPSSPGRGSEIAALVATAAARSYLRKAFAGALEPLHVPRRIECVPAIPVTPAGKRDRRAALAILAGRGGAILKNETEKNTL